jgi:biotin/methionine sulfoxide reductase
VTSRFPQLAHWGAYTAVVDNGRLVRCEPFARDPAPSPMLAAMPEMVHSPLRIAKPAVREGWLKNRGGASGQGRDGGQVRNSGEGRGAEPFVEVSWDTALSLAAEELARVRSEHGAQGIFGGSYGWASAGRLHHARTLTRRFLFAGGGCTDQVGNYSWGCAQFLLPHVVGTFEPVNRVTSWPNIIRNTKLFVAFGGLAFKNGQVVSGGTGAHRMEEWIAEARGAGVQFVVVSPTRADCPAALDAQWIAIRPNTDTAMMLAMAHVLTTEGLHDRAFLASHCAGWEKVEPYLLGHSDGTPKTPEWASAICGVPADTIRELAHRMAGTRSYLTATWSLQRAHRGEQPYWGLITLAAIVGQIGLPGGGFGFGFGSMGGMGNPRPEASSPEMAAGANSGPKIPVARMADMLLAPGTEYEFNGERHRYPDVRLVVWGGGNPFHHHQDLNRLRAAWARPETVIVNDSWWTATARRADIVFPATTPLERNDVGAGAGDRFIFAMHKAIEPVGEARNDFDIFRDLAARLGYEQAFTEGRDETQWLHHLYEGARKRNAAAGVDLPDFETFWRAGHVELPAVKKEFVLFSEFRTDPDRHPLKTPSGKIELYSERVAGFGYEDCPPHASWLPPREWLGAPLASRFPLHLVTIQPPDRLHAQMDPGPVARANKIAGRERLMMNPDDAQRRGLAAGDVVRVFNERGECLAGLQLDPGTSPGVVLMATGAWYDPVDNADKSLDRHGNPNVLAFDAGTSRLAQGPSALSVLVEIEKWQGEAPALRVFSPPRTVAA